jgi:hypothetical protein
MTVAELQTILQANSGQLTAQEALDFRNSYFAEDITEAYSQSLWVLSPDIDYVNIQPVFWYTLKKAVLDWLFSDNDQSDIDGEWDVATKQDGDKVERNIRLNSDLSQAQKDELLIDIGNHAFRIDSTKLQTAVNTANGI